MDELISRQAAIEAILHNKELYASNFGSDPIDRYTIAIIDNDAQTIAQLPPAQSEEVIPHRNYKYLSDYWCECGWHLGKKGEVKYCADCGRKVNWDE